MNRKIVRKAIIGFIAGAIWGNLVTAIINVASGNGFQIVFEDLTRSMGLGGAIVVQTILSGLYGLVCVVGTEFFDIESWSLLRSTLTHFLCIAVGYVIIGRMLGWVGFDLTLVLILAVMAVVYFVIWLVMFLRWKKYISEMNTDLEQYKKENTK